MLSKAHVDSVLYFFVLQKRVSRSTDDICRGCEQGLRAGKKRHMEFGPVAFDPVMRPKMYSHVGGLQGSYLATHAVCGLRPAHVQ
jgi:hypothetical protein